MFINRTKPSNYIWPIRFSQMAYRDVIYKQLKETNEMMQLTYGSLMASYTDLLDSVLSLKSRVKLQESAQRATSGVADELDKEKMRLVEAQLLELQKERAEFYKKKGENVEAMLDLNKRLERKELERQQCSNELNMVKVELKTLKTAHAKLKESYEELQRLNQCLKDDNVVLVSTCNAMEATNRKLTVENSLMLERWKTLNEREADLMNLQNDLQTEIHNLKLQSQLAEAARPYLNVEVAEEVVATAAAALCTISTIPCRQLTKFEAHDGEVLAIAWMHERDVLASGGTDRRVKIWEIVDGGKHSRLETLTGCNQAVTCIDVSLNDSLILAGSNDFAIRIWSMNDYRLRHALTGHSGKVLCAKFAQLQDRVVSGSSDRTLKIWDLQRRACMKTLFPGSSCNDLILSGGSSMTIISGHFDSKVRLWDYRCDTMVKSKDMPGKITSLDITSDETQLLCACRDDNLYTVDLRKDQIVRTFSAQDFRIGYDLARARFSPDCHYCTCGSANGVVYIWDASTAKVETTLLTDDCYCVTSACWSGHGTMFASSDKHKSISIWA